jgi:hypothetical protein
MKSNIAYSISPDDTVSKEIQLLKFVLEDVNRALRVQRMPPLEKLPNGLRHNDILCPLAVALGARISPILANFGNEEVADGIATVWGTSKLTSHEVVLPYVLQKFVSCFDKGQFSEYVLGASDGHQYN